MSFINLAKSGFNNMSNYGKLIGTGKNNGIKVYERIEANGKRILTSFDKEGNKLKQVTRRFTTPRDMVTTSRNYKTGVESSSRTTLMPADSVVFYDFKRTTPVEGRNLQNIDKFEFSKRSDAFTNKQSLRGVRQTQTEAFHDKSNIKSVSVTQITPEQETLSFTYYPPKQEAVLSSSGGFRMNDELVLKNGMSKYDSSMGTLSHYKSDNPHELNIAQALYNGLKHMWTK